MTDNTLIPNSAKPEPKYRKKLNEEQVAVLQLLWRFRFASSEQIAKYQQKPNGKAVQKRLKIPEDQSLIAKRYDKSYKLQGKPAAYYLTPHGARMLAL
ncbi:MAG TPA: replication-relaxation family protein [Candidatus Chromulinivoraceae bacterium]|nr:replication-relaxation family protein [Candidatus Chromulinivoraceae bacterium]